MSTSLSALRKSHFMRVQLRNRGLFFWDCARNIIVIDGFILIQQKLKALILFMIVVYITDPKQAVFTQDKQFLTGAICLCFCQSDLDHGWVWFVP